MAALRASIDSLNPMFAVPDVAEAVGWYTAIGFELTSSHENDGQLDFAQLSFGKARFSITPGPAGDTRDIGGLLLNHFAHDNRHLGMIEALRGVQGLSGTATD